MAAITLRELHEDDWPAIQQCFSDADTVRYTEFETFTEISARWLVRWALDKKQEEPRTAFVYGIEVSADAPIVGIATLTVRNPALGEADVGVIIGRDFWGKGYATAAVQELLSLGFGTLELHRISGECDPANLASARVLEKAGMKLEKYLREHRQQKGHWVDRLLYAISDRDWLTRQSN